MSVIIRIVCESFGEVDFLEILFRKENRFGFAIHSLTNKFLIVKYDIISVSIPNMNNTDCVSFWYYLSCVLYEWLEYYVNKAWINILDQIKKKYKPFLPYLTFYSYLTYLYVFKSHRSYGNV